MDRPVLLGFVPTAAASYGSQWEVIASVDDPLECNDGWMVAKGDVVFLDQRASSTAPGTVGRYLVADVLSASSRQVRVYLSWGAASVPVPPMECIGKRGYLAQPVNVSGAVQHPTQQTILVAQAVIDLAKQVDALNGEGGGTDGGTGVAGSQTRSFATDEALAFGQCFAVLPNGKAVLASPQDPARMPVVGLVLERVGSVMKGQLGGEFQGSSGLIPGEPVWVGDAGLPVSNVGSITLPAAVQLLGVAVSSTDISLTITGQMTRRS